jgi:hypothetical protein
VEKKNVMDYDYEICVGRLVDLLRDLMGMWEGFLEKVSIKILPNSLKFPYPANQKSHNTKK